MDITAYTYEADVHCIDCTQTRFRWAWNNPELNCKLPEHSHLIGHSHEVDDNGIGYEVLDREGNTVHPLFSTDEWQDMNSCDHDWDWQCVCSDTQYLTCGDCHEVIEEYTEESRG